MAEQPENPAPQASAAQVPAAQAPAPQAPPDAWSDLLPLGCLITIDLAVPKFTVRDLLRLDAGTLIEAHWKEGTHLPVLANGRQIGWAEFEVVGERLAVQLTELI